MGGEVIVKKALLNQIERIIQQKIGINPDAQKIRRLENDMRVLKGNMSTMQNKVDSRLENTCSQCKCREANKNA